MHFLCSIILLVIFGSGFTIGGFIYISQYDSYYRPDALGYALFHFLIGIVLFSLAVYIYKKACAKASEEYLNDKNDGLYWVKTNIGKEFYKIEINTNEQTITLESEGKSKVYYFNEITNFGYDKGTINLASGQVLVNFQTTRYYIKTTDPLAPVWYFKFLVDGIPALQGINYANKLDEMYVKWHQILNITLNKGVH